MQEKRKNRISKYPFGRKDIGETFEVDRTDVASMKVALKAYNIRHDESIDIDYAIQDNGRVLVTRIS